MAAVVTFSIKNNVWLTNAWQFGKPADTSWSFTGKHFLCDFKADPDQAVPTLALASTGLSPGIIVIDAVARILGFKVTDLVIRQKFSLGPYQFDLIMVDDSTGERVPLMSGVMTVEQGITIED